MRRLDGDVELFARAQRRRQGDGAPAVVDQFRHAAADGEHPLPLALVEDAQALHAVAAERRTQRRPRPLAQAPQAAVVGGDQQVAGAGAGQVQDRVVEHPIRAMFGEHARPALPCQPAHGAKPDLAIR